MAGQSSFVLIRQRGPCQTVPHLTADIRIHYEYRLSGRAEGWIWRLMKTGCSCMQFLLFVSAAEVKLHLPPDKVERKKSHCISCFTGQRRYHYSFLPQILHLKPPFHQLRGATAAEGWYLTLSLRPVTLGTGVQLMTIQPGGGPLQPSWRDYEEKREPSLSHLGCSSLRRTAIVTTPRLQAARHPGSVRNVWICL